MFLLDALPPSPMDVIKYSILQGDLTAAIIGIGILAVIIASIIIIKKKK